MVLIVAANWDLLEREFEVITQTPISFTVAILIATPLLWLSLRTIFSVRIDNLKSSNETLQIDKKSLEERLKTKDEELVKLGEEYKAKIKSDRLSANQIRVLEFIDAFESNHPPQPNQFPLECSVDEVASKLQLEHVQVDSIFKKLKREGLIASLWDGQATFLDRERPINEEKPVRLTSEGKDYLRAYREV
jgi:hypothetical protein